MGETIAMELSGIELLAKHILERRAGRGIRETAKEVGISPATLSRVENNNVPDLETFSKICIWLDEDPSIYLGIAPRSPNVVPSARVHFKKGAAIKKDSAKALGEMILAAQQALLEEELEG
jgi:transcriptional regulator with XRE-family HTH domain